MANVLLLRAPSAGEDDRYSAAFVSAGYHPVSAPVLETVSTNLSSLKAIVRAGPAAGNYDGVIVTSVRSCEAWKSVIGILASEALSSPNTSESNGMSCILL